MGSHPGAHPGPLNPNQQEKPPQAWWTPRQVALRVRRAGGRACTPLGLVGGRSGLSEHNHTGEAFFDLVPGTLPHSGPENDAQDEVSPQVPTRVLAWGLAGALEPKPAVEASPGPVDSQWAREESPGRGSHPRADKSPGPGPCWGPRSQTDREASLGPGLSGYSRLEERSARPGPSGVLVGASEHSHAGESSLGPVQGALLPDGLEEESQDRGSHSGALQGLAGAPKIKPAGEASPGLVDSQARAPQGMAG
ncbi:hypothetical protein NDU88_003026 [Pleurodeles waltl]|uniref:Androgen receptor n=1 Tax=Pleurodeles waltl TaxID=8319 RepID=A0AAV7SG26_PLEWA|nr:hypothetical protein NDU88_003026 [Pleurodeles waltl]